MKKIDKKVKSVIDTSNLKPVEPVFLINWELYREVLRHRVTVGVAKMQELRTHQLFNHMAKCHHHTV